MQNTNKKTIEGSLQWTGAIVSEDSKYHIYNNFWHDGIWFEGKWEGGLWSTGLWESGIWKYGTWNSGIWKDGLWINGTWYDGTWLNGKWYNGKYKFGGAYNFFESHNISPKDFYRPKRTFSLNYAKYN